jgi:deoxyribodipyrimidine photo-lyase
MSKPLSIHWFRQDLRLADNPALSAAVDAGAVMPVYILDDDNAKNWKLGGASRWWLHHSLIALNKSLNGQLAFYCGDAEKILSELCQQHNIDSVYWNRCYEPWRIARDTNIKNTLAAQGVSVNSFNGSLLREPWKTNKDDGTPYKVFTPFYRKLSPQLSSAQELIPVPDLSAVQLADDSLALDELHLQPTIPWYKTIQSQWSPGETGAYQTLMQFLHNGLERYKTGRDFPAEESVSRLSPYLHFGEISARQVFREASLFADDYNIEHFKREIIWREFSYVLLFNWPHIPERAFKPAYDKFPWRRDEELLKKWQQGQTGFPLVDAGMRELWQTGYMHNRVRMLVASFLVKNLLIDWRCGQAWFWDCLVDADLASNSASWQWVAGCGADASPYFRIFNPTTQGEKFDPHGEYTKKYLPELSNLPDKYLYKPWDAPLEVLDQAGVTLGENYPAPIVDLKQSRLQALDALALMKDQADV